jgi:hypothetical protein
VLGYEDLIAEQGQPAPPSLPLESRHQQGSLQVA